MALAKSRAAGPSFLPADAGFDGCGGCQTLHGFSVRIPELDEQTQHAHLPITGPQGSSSNRDGSTRQRRRRQGRPPR